MATTESSTAPAETPKVDSLTSKLEETHISDKAEKSEDKIEEGDELEDGEIREEEEVDDGKPKTVFDSQKNYNLKVCLSTYVY
jgi:hypothetical protein